MGQDELVGKNLGNCRLEALVGRGGMGRVYRARHLALDRIVAVKLVDRSASAEIKEAVLAEARAAAKLDDPRVVAVYEVGEDLGLPYIVLQWVDGEGLDARVKRAGPLPPPEALGIMKEAAAALGAAHAAGLVHCDVKPANIMVDRKGAVKLADFGIARQAGVATGHEQVSGSFHFMAPEQAMGAPPDPRSDLYGLGAVWYFVLTGEPLFPGAAADALIRHRDEPAPDVRRKRPEVTEKCAALIARLLAKEPAERPQDAATLIREMSSVGMLLDTDASGSPFRILPAPPPDEPTAVAPPIAPPAPRAAAPVPASAPAPVAAAPAPRRAAPIAPPPVPKTAALGDSASFYAFFLVFAAVGVAWPWRHAAAEDWTAGAFFLAAFPAALTIGDRRDGWRKALSVLLWLGALACGARAALGAGGAAVPPLETMIAAGAGAVASGGAVFLGHWGEDADDALWARVLAPFGAALLLVGVLNWTVPDGRGWIDFLRERARADGGAWWNSGGAWRWGGLALLAGAIAGVRRIRTVAKPAPERKLNWNR